MKTTLLFIFSLVIGITLIYIVKMGIRQANYATNPDPKPVSFSLEKAPSESIKGNITSLSGNVGWQSRIATEPAQIISFPELQQGEAVETKDNGKMTLQFGNILASNLSPNTFLNFIQTLPTQFVIDQSKGKTEYVKLGETPLTVRSFGLLINIESGNVVVSINDKLGVMTSTVKKGSITAAYNDPKQETANVLTVNEGSQYIFNNDTKQGEIKTIQ